VDVPTNKKKADSNAPPSDTEEGDANSYEQLSSGPLVPLQTLCAAK